MVAKTTLVAALLVGSSMASAAALELTPTAQNSVSVTYERYYGGEYGCGGEAPYSVPGGGGGLGFSGSAPSEGRHNVEYTLPPQALRAPATATLSFTIARGDGSSDYLPLCVLGYKGDGRITQSDFVTGGTYLGGAGFFFDPSEYERQLSIDISSYLANFRPGRDANILGLQFAIGHYDADYGISNIRLTVTPGRVPEPLALSLLGLGVLGLAGARRIGRLKVGNG